MYDFINDACVSIPSRVHLEYPIAAFRHTQYSLLLLKSFIEELFLAYSLRNIVRGAYVCMDVY